MELQTIKDEFNGKAVSNESVAESTNMICENNVWYHVDPSTKIKSSWDHVRSVWVPSSVPSQDSQKLVEVEKSSSLSENMKFNGKYWIYQDPVSGKEMKYDSAQGKWVAYVNAVGSDTEKEHEDATASTSDVSESENDDNEEEMDELEYQLKMERLEKKRVRRQQKQSNENDTTNGTSPTTVKAKPGATYTDKDGAVFEWDESKRGWLPKVDDNFIARYQSQYGVGTFNQQQNCGDMKDSEVIPPDPTPSTDKIDDADTEASTSLAAQKRKKPNWFAMEEVHNTSVYISNLPTSITMEEFKKESVELALQILDGADLKGKKVKVELAKFEMKGGKFDPSKKKKKLPARMRKKLKEKQEKLFSWQPDKLRGERLKSDSVVILKNVFTPAEFMGNEGLLLELQGLIERECAKYGELKKVIIYDNNPEGVAMVSFREPESADDCITMFDYKVLRTNTDKTKELKVRAQRWDGKTKFLVEETAEQRKERLEEWKKFLASHD